MLLKILAQVFTFLHSAAGFDINKMDVNEELGKEVVKGPPHVHVGLKRHIPLLSGGKE